MFKQVTVLLIILFLVVFFAGACEEENGEEQLPPESYSVGEAELETGKELDEDHRIVSMETTFAPNEDLYFSFFNDEPFGEDEVMVQLIDTATDEVLAEEDYSDEVEPESEIVFDKIWFGGPGRYKILVEVDGEERAWQEVIIEEEQE